MFYKGKSESDTSFEECPIEGNDQVQENHQPSHTEHDDGQLGVEEETRDEVPDLPNVAPSRQSSEKRKAPNRPPPPQRMESLNENEVST